jgi:hypothetical protein
MKHIFTYRVTFERIGRRRDVEPLIITVDGYDRQDLAEEIGRKVHRYVGKFLTAREYAVSVLLDPKMKFGNGGIAAGMYGTFVVEIDVDPSILVWKRIKAGLHVAEGPNHTKYVVELDPLPRLWVARANDRVLKEEFTAKAAKEVCQRHASREK